MVFLAIQMKKLRKEREYTQKQLAEQMNIKTDTYKNYESGRSVPNMDLLLFLSSFYGVSIDYLLGLKNDRITSTEKDMRNHFSKKLKCLRISHNLSARALGKQLGLSERIVSYYETGQKVPRLERIILIAKYFQVSVDELIR